MFLLSSVLCLLFAFVDKAVSQENNDEDSKLNSAENIKTLLLYIFSSAFCMIVLFGIYRKYKNARSQRQPLLGNQYTPQGQILTRHEVMQSDAELGMQWKCEICDFYNSKTTKFCVLCGTEKGFTLLLPVSNGPSSAALTPLDGQAFNRQRSFAIRRLNMLNARQRGARNRLEWVRRVGLDGKNHWCRARIMDSTTKLKSTISTTPTSGLTHSCCAMRESSLAFVSQLATTPSDPHGKIITESTSVADPFCAMHRYKVSQQDLEVLEQVAALPFKDKYGWFLSQTAALMKPFEEGHEKFVVHRDRILEESVSKMCNIPKDRLHLTFRITFEGEQGIDAGGLLREWFALVCEKMFDEKNGLFLCAQVDNLAYVINPNSQELKEDHLMYYYCFGRLLGRALLEGHLLEPHLALPMLKHFLGVPISLSDLEFLDLQVYKSMVWLRECSNVAALDLDFTVMKRSLDGSVETVELKPNGKNILVVEENKEEYIYLRLKYMILDSIEEQLKMIMKGLFEIIPQELMLVFDYQELELLLCGVPFIDVDDWKKYSIVGKGISSKYVKWFWEIVEDYSNEERARLLQFCTGTSRVPVQGFRALTSYDGRICHFTIIGLSYPRFHHPKSHTCFNRIDLPLYPSKSQLEEALSLVINMEITGFSVE